MSEYRLIQGDCLDVLPTLTDGVDLVFFDPPYGVGIAEWDATFTAHEAASLSLAKLKGGGSLYATCSLHILPDMMRLIPYRRIIAWGKPNLPLRKNLREWEWSTEFVLWATNGEPSIFNKPHGEDGRDYWRIPVENGFLRPDNFNHPARKPVALLRRIIEASTRSGDLVLDPFMGSASCGVACLQTGRRYIGIERDAAYFDMAQERLAQAAQQVRLAL